METTIPEEAIEAVVPSMREKGFVLVLMQEERGRWVASCTADEDEHFLTESFPDMRQAVDMLGLHWNTDHEGDPTAIGGAYFRAPKTEQVARKRMAQMFSMNKRLAKATGMVPA